MTEPVFDENGWCSDMDAAPGDYQEVLLFDADSGGVFCGLYVLYGEIHIWPTHWKPLGPGPVGT